MLKQKWYMLIRVKLWMWILMNIVSWSDVQNRPVGLTCHKWQSNIFRKTRLTCHKWKADTTKLKGIGEANDPDKGVGEADNPNEVVGEVDDPVVAMLGLHVCIYKEISCAPRLVLVKKTPTKKGFQKIRSWGFL